MRIISIKEKVDNMSVFRRIILGTLTIVCLVIALEVFIFNFRHWQFLGNRTPVVVDNWTMSEGLSFADYNAFQVDNIESRPYIEIAGLDMPLNLLYFDFVNVQRGDYAVLDIEYQLELTDEGNALPYIVPSRMFFRLVDKTHYTTINPYGNIHSVRVYFDNLNEGDIIRVCSFIMNPGYSWQISKKRMLVLFLFLYVLWIVRPNSSIHEVPVFEKDANRRRSWGKRAAILAVLVFEIIVFYKVTHLSRYFDNIEPGGQTQFMQLAEAIVDRGEVFLDAIPAEGLADMADPYDAMLRNATVGPYSNIGDMSDTGYYKGRYFVYFGIAPIILFYVPYYAITGMHIATRTVFFIIASINCIGVLFLLYEICRKYFKSLSFAIYIMFSVLFTFGAGQLYLALSPDFYAVPIMFALTCIEFGLGCWLHALSCNEKVIGNSSKDFKEWVEDSDEKMPWGWLAAGSLLMALPAASRPQFLIASFLAIVLFWNSVFKSRSLLSKTSIAQTVAFVVPYVIVAAGVMYYNYIRFENVFDFGANYNFCYNNMPYRGWHIDRLLHPLVGYLFYPCTVTNRFPFFEYSSYISGYTGITADETLFGGVIYNNIYLILSLFALRFRKIISDKTACIIAIIAPIFSIIVGVVDANMAGTLPRYYADFTWGYMVSAFIVLGYLLVSKEYVTYRRIIMTLFYVAFIWTSIRLFLMPFAGSQLFNNNKMAYYMVKSLVEFWY